MIPRTYREKARREWKRHTSELLTSLQNHSVKFEIQDTPARMEALIQICVGLGITNSELAGLRENLKEWNLDNLVSLRHLIMSGVVTWENGKLRLRGFQ
jgi:GTP cyclohydrolase I